MSIPNRSRIALLVAAATIGLAAQPALADEPKAETRVAAGTLAYPVSEDTRVCIKETFTGSRIPRKICHTMKEWKAQGMDPFAKR